MFVQGGGSECGLERDCDQGLEEESNDQASPRKGMTGTGPGMGRRPDGGCAELQGEWAARVAPGQDGKVRPDSGSSSALRSPPERTEAAQWVVRALFPQRCS